jgi:hypothetical protein
MNRILFFSVLLLIGAARPAIAQGQTPNAAQPYVVLYPDPSGDSYPELQRAIDNYINTGTGWLLLMPGVYRISHPLIAAKIVPTGYGNDYGQVSLRMEGTAFAKNAPGKYTAHIVPTYNNTFALGIQKGKGCIISNISFEGQYTKPSSLGVLDIDTLPFAKWSDGKAADNRSAPYAGIVIDPFSSKDNYDGVTYKMYEGLQDRYLPVMSHGGSTAIQITGCSFQNFVVGVMVTPSMTYNAEEIDCIDCSISNCRSAYAFSQAQSKANTISRLQVWGGVHTILDGAHWGFHHSDGAICPMVDVVNIAGTVHQLLFAGAYSFPITIKRVYAEGLFKIGWADAYTHVHFQDCQIDFQNGNPGVPTPDVYFFGRGVIWDNCMLRIYNGGDNCVRLVWNSPDNFFIGGSLSAPPVVNPVAPPKLQSTQMYYKGPHFLNTNKADYDTVFRVSAEAEVRCDRSRFKGTVTGVAGVRVGDVLLTEKENDEEKALNGGINKQYPLGFVTAVSGNTVTLQNMGMGIRDGRYPVWVSRLR